MLPVMSLEVLVAKRPLRNNISFAIQAFTNCCYIALFYECELLLCEIQPIHITYQGSTPFAPVHLAQIFNVSFKSYLSFRAIISISTCAPNGNEATPIVVLAG